jgi:hypothetical protein
LDSLSKVVSHLLLLLSLFCRLFSSLDPTLLKNSILLLRDLLSFAKRSALHKQLNSKLLLDVILPAIAREFSQQKTELKIVLLECLECSVTILEKSASLQAVSVAVEDHIRIGLGHLLTSKLGNVTYFERICSFISFAGDQERRHVLYVTAALMNYRGIAWASRDMKKSEMTPSPFLQLLLHRVRIEIDLHLDPHNEEAKKTAGAREQILAVCFVIVENVLVALVLQAGTHMR